MHIFSSDTINAWLKMKEKGNQWYGSFRLVGVGTVHVCTVRCYRVLR